MKNKSTIIIASILLVFGLAMAAHTAQVDITTDAVTVSGTDRINDEQGRPMTVPAGVIVMWSGTTVPTGWHVCDGTNGTPDLRDRFILGAGGTNNIGDTGGSSTHNHTGPSHTHPFSHKHELPFGLVGSGGPVVYSPSDVEPFGIGASFTRKRVNYYGDDGQTGADNYSLTNTPYSVSTTGAEGTGNTNTVSNIPNFYALAFIMKLP